MPDDRVRVAVLCGGPSSEHDISLATGFAVLHALDPERFRGFAVAIRRNGSWTLPEARLPDRERDLACGPPAPTTAEALRRLAELDIVFNALHGAWGEDGRVQGLLESLGLPYTGSGVLASALAFDKVRCRRLLAGARVPLAPGRAFPTGSGIPGAGSESLARALPSIERAAARLGYPVCVKPAAGGSSVGVSRVETRADLGEAVRRAAGEGSEILLERWEEGIEITVPVLGNAGSRDATSIPRALPVVQIVPRAGTFFDFRSKYSEGGADEIAPARLADATTRRLQSLGVRVHELVGCRGLSRIDMILTSRGPVVLEINTLPGLTPLSLFPRSASAAGISLEDLCVRLLDLAGGVRERGGLPAGGKAPAEAGTVTGGIEEAT